MILDDVEYQNGDVIYQEDVNCAGVRQLSRESRSVERLEPQGGKDKSSFKLIKQKKVTFEDDITNMKTKMNHNLFSQTIEEIKRMEYSERTVNFITRVIEDLKNNKMKKAQAFHTGIYRFWKRRA